LEVYHENQRNEYSIKVMTNFSRSVPHWHQNAELLYILNGRFTIDIGGNCYTGLPGDIFLANSGEIHNLQPQIEGSGMYVVVFNPALLTMMHRELRFVQSYIPEAWQKAAGIDQTLRSLLDSCYEEMQSKQVWSDVMIQTGFLRVYALLLRHFEKDIGAENHAGGSTRFSDFQTVLSYIYSNYGEDITLQSIAQKLNYSPAYVSTIFSTYAGRNFKAYLDNIRVNRAADLLKKTGLNISEIAMQCGFSTLRTFNNTFRRIIGTTPTAYRSEDTQSN